MQAGSIANGTTAIWGSGSKCVAFLHATGSVDRVDAIIDINPHRRGRFIPSIAIPVSHAHDLAGIDPERVVVMNGFYANEIKSLCMLTGVDPSFLVLGKLQPELREI